VNARFLIPLRVRCSAGLDYNQLKRLLLRTLADNGSMDSDTLLGKLSSTVGDPFEIHAVRMALVRYYRQGLLKRERAEGRFTYSLSRRGTARLGWLEDQSRDPNAARFRRERDAEGH